MHACIRSRFVEPSSGWFWVPCKGLSSFHDTVSPCLGLKSTCHSTKLSNAWACQHPVIPARMADDKPQAPIAGSRYNL